jgi:hypothetical protein
VPSKDPAIVRRRSRGSLPRLHLRLFSSSSKCSLFESSRRSKVTVRPLHKDQAPSLTPRQVSFGRPKNASRLLQTLNVRHPTPCLLQRARILRSSRARHPPGSMGRRSVSVRGITRSGNMDSFTRCTTGGGGQINSFRHTTRDKNQPLKRLIFLIRRQRGFLHRSARSSWPQPAVVRPAHAEAPHGQASGPHPGWLGERQQ